VRDIKLRVYFSYRYRRHQRSQPESYLCKTSKSLEEKDKLNINIYMVCNNRRWHHSCQT